VTMPCRLLHFVRHLAVLCALFVPLPSLAAQMQFDVDVRYLYGDWHWGDSQMRSATGLAGPEARFILGDRWSARLTYLTGDFAAVGAVPLDDPVYHSRRNYSLDDRRETLDAAFEFHPLPFLTAALIYRFARYEHASRIELDSDQRLYGEGLESTVAELSAWGLGVRSRIRLVEGLHLGGEAAWFPRVRTEASGRYQFTMLYRSDRLDERWYGQFEPTGLRAGAEITYDLDVLPATLATGYLVERFDDDDARREGWLSDYLAGGGRDWRKDHLQGVTLRAGFHF